MDINPPFPYALFKSCIPSPPPLSAWVPPELLTVGSLSLRRKSAGSGSTEGDSDILAFKWLAAETDHN
jgi:hypothetical protein